MALGAELNTQQPSLFDQQSPPDPRWQRLYDGVSSEMLERFNDFDRENPRIYELFVRFAKEAKQAGRPRFSHWMIANRIRWFTTVETRGDTWKLNNNWIAFYVRKLVYEHPEFEGFFDLRECKQASKN